MIKNNFRVLVCKVVLVKLYLVGRKSCKDEQTGTFSFSSYTPVHFFFHQVDLY